MRRVLLVPVLLAATLTWACDGPPPTPADDAGQVGVKVVRGGPPAELVTIRLAIAGMG